VFGVGAMLTETSGAFYTLVMNELVHSKRPMRMAKPAAKRVRVTTRTNDPERTMAGIMQVATQEFAAKGLAGARIDAIADATHTSKRMIYYYFGSKEGLYLAVLEESYRRIRQTEEDLQLSDLPPAEGLAKLVGFTFDHHYGNQDFVRLVMSENIQYGKYLAQSKLIQDLNVSVIHSIQSLYQRGVQEGVFRKGLDPIDIHASISALTFFNVSNRYTFDLIFKRNGHTPKAISLRRQRVIEMVLRFCVIDNTHSS
jgi:AcrR family transcriptional regulator